MLKDKTLVVPGEVPEKPNGPDKLDVRASLIQYGLAAVLGCLGVVIGSVLTYQQTIRSQDNDFRLHFAGTIKDATPALSDGKTAAMTYASLYALARDDDRAYKRILMIIGYSTSFSSVKTVLAEFIEADKQMQSVRDEPAMVKVVQSQATVTAKASAQTISASSVNGSHDQASVQARVTPDAGQVALLSAAVPSSTKPAWMYYGRLGLPGKDPLECFDTTKPVPKPGMVLTLCSSRYVRDAPTAVDSQVITALGAGSQVEVLGQHIAPIPNGSKVVWLSVKFKH